MAQGSSKKYVQHLHDNVRAIGEFSECLDPKFKKIKNWEEFAFLLGIPADVLRTCGLYCEYSPTIRLFKYLQITQPDMSIDDLRNGLTRNEHRTRQDIITMISDISGKEKVSEAITNSTSNHLDQIARKLDSATKPTCGWEQLGLELNVKPDKLQQFEMYINYNPAEALFRCLYSTNKESIELSVILDFLGQMERGDILRLEEIKTLMQSEDISTKKAKDVFELGSELLDKTAQLLNKDTVGVGVGGWRRLAQLLVEEHYIDVPNLVSSLEPPHQHEIHSPTKKAIEWLAANKPNLTMENLITACENIKREDAVLVLLNHFSRAIELDTDEQDSDSLRHSVQATSEIKDHILLGKTQSFGLPESTKEVIGRKEEIEDLVSYVSSGEHRLAVLHGPTGSGKETLAIAAARKLMELDYTCIHVTSDGVLGVEDLAVKILTTCGIPTPSVKMQEKVKELFKTVNQKCVLILENFDHMFRSGSGTYTEVGAIGDDRTSTSISSSIDSNTDAFDTTSSSLPTRGNSFKKRMSGLFSSFFGSKEKIGCNSSDDFSSTVTRNILSRANCEFFPWQSGNEMSQKQKYHDFLEDLLVSVPNLTIVATTWESLSSTRVSTKQVELQPLSTKDSEQLLLTRCKSVLGIDSSNISRDILDTVIKCCSGNPQLLLNAVVVFNDLGTTAGATYIASSPLEEQLGVLNPSSLPNENRVNHCLCKCFKRLDKNSQNVLIMVSVLPGSFTVEEATAIFKENFELQRSLVELKRFHFLCYNKEQQLYFLTPAMRSFAMYVATISPSGLNHDVLDTGTQSLERDWNCTYKSAISRFVYYTFDITYKIEKGFFSTDSKDAIDSYRIQEENLKEIAYWCISGRLSSDPDLERIKHYVIHSFVECSLVNIKLMKTHLLKTIFCKFSRMCQGSGDNEFLDCVIYGGAAFIINCLCVPQLCVFAQNKAMWCFRKVVEAMSESCPSQTCPSLNRQLEIVSKSEAMSKGAQTQFLVKYGKCLVRQGRKEIGLEFIKEGIEIRQKEYKKSNSVKDLVMVAVGYNDLACAYSYMSDSQWTAIYIRLDKVLPDFQRYLGRHPFTASALSHLAHDYLAVNSYEKALTACSKALSHRVSLLGSHSETARSLFDMGRIIRKQAYLCEDPEEKKKKYEEALEYFEAALKMRQLLAYVPRETATTHQEIAEVLKMLERDYEAQEHDDKIPSVMKTIDSSHVN